MQEQTTAGAEHHGQHGGCFFCATAMPFLERLWTGAARDHFRSSRIEFLMGLRSLIDDRIAYLSREQGKGTHVPVD